MNSISDNIEIINQRIQEAAEKSGRSSKSIHLIAVSKTKPNAAIIEALNAGHKHFGENRMQELHTKMKTINDPKIQWHMIGGIQSNKIKYITSHVHWIHSIDKTKYISEVNKRAEQEARTINLLIQVNISEEHQKNGCNPTELEGILDFARSCTNIKVKGLMGMAKFSTDPESIRGEFALLKSTFDKHVHLNGGNIQLRELSMGMSNDFEIAVEEGATMIRVGSAIFGARNYG